MTDPKLLALVEGLEAKVDLMIAKSERNELMRLLIDREDRGDWWKDGGEAPF